MNQLVHWNVGSVLNVAQLAKFNNNPPALDAHFAHLREQAQAPFNESVWPTGFQAPGP